MSHYTDTNATSPRFLFKANKQLVRIILRKTQMRIKLITSDPKADDLPTDTLGPDGHSVFRTNPKAWSFPGLWLATKSQGADFGLLLFCG